jgi:hypothetical protein
MSIYFKSANISDIKLWLYDKSVPNLNLKAKKLDYEYFNHKESTYYIPLSLVDTFYKFDYLKKERKVIRTERNIKLFFAGNFNEKHDNKYITQKFNCPTRFETYQYLQINFNLRNPEKASFEDLMSEENEILIFDRNIRNVPPQELVKFLNNSRFFLAFPGVVMPLCHNIIEAMAIGCIPVLNYNHLFSPKLTNDVNCLTYSSLDDLKNVIDNLNSIDETSLAAMRENVLEYYEEHLSIKSVVDNILNTDAKHVSLCAEHQSVELIKN